MSAFVDIFGTIVDGVRYDWDSDFLEPYYLYGHPQDIFGILAEKDTDITFKFQKYPLICLFQDFEEESDDARTTITGITIVIVTETSADYRAKDRYENIYIPTLQPLYESLISHIKKSKYVFNDDLYKHKKIDRLYWGKGDEFGNSGNIGNDKLDAIVISDLTLEIETCKDIYTLRVTEDSSQRVTESGTLRII